MSMLAMLEFCVSEIFICEFFAFQHYLNIGLIMVPMVKPILQTLLSDLWLLISS